jgi:hypothetical protein
MKKAVPGLQFRKKTLGNDGEIPQFRRYGVIDHDTAHEYHAGRKFLPFDFLDAGQPIYDKHPLIIGRKACSIKEHQGASADKESDGDPETDFQVKHLVIIRQVASEQVPLDAGE